MSEYIIQGETLEDIANAIRSKSMTESLIDTNQMSSKIKQLNTVEFIGSDIEAYPNSNLLVQNGYTHSVEDIENELSDNNYSKVYKRFKTNDDCIHLIIDKTSSLNGFEFYFYQSNENLVTVDWGDGSEPELSGTKTGSNSMYHDYSNKENGYYDIKITGNDSFRGFYFTQTVPTGWGSELPTPGELALIAVYFPSSEDSGYLLGREGGFFKSLGLKHVILPKSEDIIGNSTFKRCESLERIILPNNITGIRTGTFMYCEKLTEVYIPDTVTSISSDAFKYCTSLKNIKLSKNLVSLGGFQGCSGLTNITIPDKVTSIFSQAFYDCSSLKEVHVKPISPPSLGTNVFTGTSSNIKIYVPYSSDHSILNSYKTATNWSTYDNKIFEEPEP